MKKMSSKVLAYAFAAMAAFGAVSFVTTNVVEAAAPAPKAAAKAKKGEVKVPKEEVDKTIDQRLNEKVAAQQATVNVANLPKVAIMYKNNAQTTFDTSIDYAALMNLDQAINPQAFAYVNGTAFVNEMAANGASDFAMVERSEVIKAVAGKGIDYVMLLQVEPVTTKDTVTYFTTGKIATGSVICKVVDVKNDTYLYNGKISDSMKESSVIGAYGNKSITLKLVNKINSAIFPNIAAKLGK